ncbi:tripartite motif-containing protein 2 [Aplysia californica]|uniref:Tripartite motif-containing protein 2 n=1 Tax=Aplysia californica TaxID=6500 RepID=A0ABM1ABZ9_APLCA|nr:tripartite motif-containing protein 2 [Aplysia californica]
MTTTVSRYWSGHANLLSCAICDQRYKQPKVLPCLHTFCEQCLCAVIPCESLSVTCPVCRQQSILPLEGVSALQTNVFIANLLKVIALPDICSSCGGVASRPTSKCLDCEEFLCDPCSLIHTTMDTANNNDSNTNRNNHTNNNGVAPGNNHRPVNGDSMEDHHTDDNNTTANHHHHHHHSHHHHHHQPPLDEYDDDDNLENSESRGGGGQQHHIVSLEQLSISPVLPGGTGGGEGRGGTALGSGDGGGGGERGGGDTGQGAEEATIVCPNHSGSALKYYCAHCDTAVCEACTQVEHVGHATVVLSEAVHEQKSSLTSLVSRVRQMSPEVTRAIEVIDDTCHQLEANTREVEERIKALFEEVSSLVEARKRVALNELAQVTASKTEVLHEQKRNLEQHLARMRSLCELTEESLQHGRDTDVVLVKKEMAGKLSELVNSGLSLQPDTNPLAYFDDKEFVSVRTALSQLGLVCDNPSVPAQTTAGGEAFSGCVAGKASSVTVTTRDRNGDLVKTGFAPLQAFISSDMSEDRLTPHLTDHQNGTYDLTFTVSSPGVYYLTVTLFDQHVRGSPYKIRAADHSELNGGTARVPRTMAVKQKGVKRPSSSRSQGSSNRRTNRIEDDLLMRVGVRGRNKGEFSNPQGLCYSEERVLVCDSNNQNVQVFAPSGECRLRFGTAGRAPGKMQRPTGVAVTQNGNFLVADYDNKWISIFCPEGKYLSRIGATRLQGPKGVAVDREGRIIVVDNKSSCILIFQSNGKLLHKFGSRGNRDDQFAGPHYAAINEQNDIIVSDFHNHCVKVFDRDGHFKFSFGSNGEGNGQFNAPTGVAVDDKGNMLVADWGNSRIQVFDSSGSFLSYVNCASEPLYGPQGLAVTSQGVVVVADSGNHCIKYYKYLQ